MKVIFADSFHKSLRKLERHNKWWYKIYLFIRYDIRRMVYNIWVFRSSLYNFYAFDYTGTLYFMRTSLKCHLNSITNGDEIEETRNKKTSKIKRAVEILDNILEDRYINIAEKEVGVEIDTDILKDITPKEREVYELSSKIEETEWEELWGIIKGNPCSEHKGDDSGLRSWWC